MVEGLLGPAFDPLDADLTMMDDLSAQSNGKQYNPKVHQELLREIESIEGTNREVRENVGSLQTEIKRLNTNLKHREQLTQEVEQLHKRLENIEILKNLFRARGFVNYISSIYLQNLCSAANDRFTKLTRQKLKLELNEANNFEVRDFWNDGRVRSVKTLSGGQMFQAALSLSLALSDSIQHLAGSEENFFFIDEGFGNLDKQALKVVFDTLQALRKENRIVGVISHVDEMHEEIPTCILVERDDERGTTLKVNTP